MVMSYPYTVYSVALLYLSRDGTKHILSSQLIHESGRNPLATDEVVRRARDAFDRGYNSAANGDRSGWVDSTAAASYAIVDR
ncbi:unnamed protein product [Gemmataceae bacterium]|nr:unnamed protein product [Gemmataceae bacterium]VTT98926.1 unnamed protein product [Gemmataceae bacterium]